MSRYELDKLLREVAKLPGACERFESDRAAYVAARLLDDAERQALIDADTRAIFELGAHPFLLYSFALRLAGGWSVAFMEQYVERLQGLELTDIST